jgi:phage-related tail protein
MNEEQLVQFAKEGIQTGKGFGAIQTALITQHGKNMGEANRILELAKEELGMSADTTEEDIKQSKYRALGDRLNVISWIVLIVAILASVFKIGSENMGVRLFCLALAISGIAIYLREWMHISFFKARGFIAKVYGGLIFFAGLSGLVSSCQ